MKRIAEMARKHVWVLFLIAFLAFMGFGLFRGEAIDVYEKARTICLECIGIG
jgi:hypothetical protein